MNYLSHTFIIFSLIGFSKAGHFIKLVVLAGLGLAGLWMVHTLAQDYNTINHGGGVQIGGGGKTFEKRSIDSRNQYGINWEFVLSRDPARCARSFICQLAAENEKELDETGKKILELSRSASEKDSRASKQILEALKYGEAALNPKQCRKIYKLCPYSSQTMTTLLKLFGG